MIEALERYIDTEFVYRFTQGPAAVQHDEARARREGINCVSLAHLAIQSLFGYMLPPHLHCYELFSDTTRFMSVGTAGDMQAGDLVWFGRVDPRVAVNDFVPVYREDGMLLNWSDNPVTHVGVFTGEHAGEEPLVLHSTPVIGTNVVWPLKEFAAYPRYEKIYRISRLALANMPEATAVFAEGG